VRDKTAARDVAVSENTAVRWPYAVGLLSLSFGVLALVFAPISGILYLALPGVAFAAYHALSSRSPARVAVAVSAASLTAGVVVGAVALYSFLGDDFALQEWTTVLALFVMPLLALVVGLPALTVAYFRPGTRNSLWTVGQAE